MRGAIEPLPQYASMASKYVFTAWCLVTHRDNSTIKWTTSALSKELLVLDHSCSRIVGLNPFRGLDVCPRFLCCVAMVLCHVEYVVPKCVKEFIVLEVDSELSQAEELNPRNAQQVNYFTQIILKWEGTKSVITSVLLYGCVKWSVNLRKEHKSYECLKTNCSGKDFGLEETKWAIS
jgi:hypothetical protein